MKRKVLTEKQYEKLAAKQQLASRENDYSKMIMAGSPIAIAMKEYEQDNLCKHDDVGTNGGGDYCKLCGKTWN